MTYDDAMDGYPVTRAEAFAELRAHHADLSDFIADCGDRDEYESDAVLAWLGY